MLRSILRPYGDIATSAEADSQALWRAVRDVTPFAASVTGAERPVWRISTAPTRGPEVGALLTASLGAEILYDWAGGLLWALVPASEDAGAASVRKIVTPAGGHATLIRANAAVRAAVDVFDPQDEVAPHGPRESPGIESRADVAQMDEPRRGRRKPCAHTARSSRRGSSHFNKFWPLAGPAS